MAHDVELEPVPSARVGGLDVLDGGGPESGEGEGDARGARGAGARDLALGLHEAGETGGGDAEGHGGGAAEDLARGVDGGCRPQDVGVELDVAEGLTGPTQGDLALGGAVGVVEGGRGRASPGDRAQVPDGLSRLESPVSGVQIEFLEVEQVEDLVRVGDLALDHGGIGPRHRVDRTVLRTRMVVTAPTAMRS